MSQRNPAMLLDNKIYWNFSGMPGSSVTSDSSRDLVFPDTDPEMLPSLGPKMEGARQNICSKHVLISLGLHLDI